MIKMSAESFHARHCVLRTEGTLGYTWGNDANNHLTIPVLSICQRLHGVKNEVTP